MSEPSCAHQWQVAKNSAESAIVLGQPWRRDTGG